MRYAALLMVGVLVVPSGACEDGGTGPDGGEAVIEGRIESTTTLARSGPAATSAQTAQASTVEVVSVASGGSATVLAEATADASGDFRVEGVPAGRTDLIVVARNESGAEVGRVIAHGETEAQAVTVVAPINAETSVEGGAFVDLRADGRAEVAANSGGLAAFVRMSRAEAEAVASSESAVEGVAEGYAESEATLTAVLDAFDVDLDAQARGELTAPLALDYAIDRDGGTGVEVAHDAFVEAVLTAYVDAGAEVRTLALSTAASASGAAHASTGAESGVRLAIVRQAVDMHLRIREELAASASGVPGAEATVGALAQARASLESSGSVSEIEAELRGVGTAVEAAVLVDVLDLLSGFELDVQSAVQAEIEAAFDEADLAARLEGAASAGTRASVVAEYRTDVEAAVGAVADAMPEGVSLDTEAMVALLIAASGSAAVS